jgi:DNA-binding NarL/FixJ family response regulator
VLRLLAEGKRMKEFAADLDISVRTVENHKAHLLQVLSSGQYGRPGPLRHQTAHRAGVSPVPPTSVRMSRRGDLWLFNTYFPHLA